MKYLIDTQILLWLFGDGSKLSSQVLSIIKDKENQLFVSIASFWEIAIKLTLGKLTLPIDLAQFVEETLSNNIEILSLKVTHILKLNSLPLHHRDPFDRLIIAQSMEEGLPVLSIDEKFSLYAINKIW